MKDKTYYGILMQKVLIDNDIYLFKPQSLLEGTYLVDEDNTRSFVDTLNYEYSLIEDIDSTYDYDVSIGYMIEESDLLSKYPNMDISKAKSNYFESILKNVHFGFYNYNTNRLVIVKGDLRTVLSRVNNEEEIEELQFDSESEPKLKEGIYFDLETFQKMARETDAFMTQLEEKVTTFLCALDELKQQNLQVEEYEKFLYHVIDIIDTKKERKRGFTKSF